MHPHSHQHKPHPSLPTPPSSILCPHIPFTHRQRWSSDASHFSAQPNNHLLAWTRRRHSRDLSRRVATGLPVIRDWSCARAYCPPWEQKTRLRWYWDGHWQHRIRHGEQALQEDPPVQNRGERTAICGRHARAQAQAVIDVYRTRGSITSCSTRIIVALPNLPPFETGHKPACA